MKILAQNRRARFDYEILETFEAGMMLTGAEAKSARMGHIHLLGSYVVLERGKVILRGAQIAPYRYAHDASYQPIRDRQLLLKKAEVHRIERAITEKGVTAVPLEVKSGKFLKLVVALAKGKKRHDKRNAIKKREVERKLREGKEY